MVDNTEKGWFVQWIDRDPEAIRRQEAMLAKEKMDLDDEERTSRFIQQQIVRAADSAKHSTVTEFTDLQRRDDDDKGSGGKMGDVLSAVFCPCLSDCMLVLLICSQWTQLSCVCVQLDVVYVLPASRWMHSAVHRLGYVAVGVCIFKLSHFRISFISGLRDIAEAMCSTLSLSRAVHVQHVRAVGFWDCEARGHWEHPDHTYGSV